MAKRTKQWPAIAPADFQRAASLYGGHRFMIEAARAVLLDGLTVYRAAVLSGLNQVSIHRAASRIIALHDKITQGK